MPVSALTVPTPRGTVGHLRLVCGGMAAVVLRVRLTSGDMLDVSYEHADAAADQDDVVNYVVSTFAEESGLLRCTHGERLLVIYSRGVSAVEVSPRGAVL